jgi:hypothetical protein
MVLSVPCGLIDMSAPTTEGPTRGEAVPQADTVSFLATSVISGLLVRPRRRGDPRAPGVDRVLHDQHFLGGVFMALLDAYGLSLVSVQV